MELEEFNPAPDIEFGAFLTEVRNRAISSFVAILVEGTLIRFIANMNEQGLDKDLTVAFSHSTTVYDSSVYPTLVLTLKAHGETKSVFELVLTKDKKRIRNLQQIS